MGAEFRDSVRKDLGYFSSMLGFGREELQNEAWLHEHDQDGSPLGPQLLENEPDFAVKVSTAETDAERSPECPRNKPRHGSKTEVQRPQCPLAPAAKMLCPVNPGPRPASMFVDHGPFTTLFTLDLSDNPLETKD
jgi:hypothetical protein